MNCATIGLHHLRKAARQDRDHEGPEEPLDDPCPPVLRDLRTVPCLAPDSPPPPSTKAPKMPGAIARTHHVAIEPDDI